MDPSSKKTQVGQVHEGGPGKGNKRSHSNIWHKRAITLLIPCAVSSVAKIIAKGPELFFSKIYNFFNLIFYFSGLTCSCPLRYYDMLIIGFFCS